MMYSDSDDGARNPMKDELGNDVNEPPTKRMYRLNTWTNIKRLYSKGSGNSRYINRKIPLFPDTKQTAERLAETPEFKDAKNIKVNIDMAQEWVKLQVLKANKTLFVAPTQKSSYLYAKIKTPENLDELDPDLVQQRRIVKMLAGKETYEELTIDQAEPLDMVVVGCVAVSKRGQRIGKGNGYVDLEIAVLHSLGVITPKTVIATTVADQQVYDEFPEELFQNYDFTVDLIVTPQRVIRVDPRPEQRTIGVQWGLLSSRRLDVMRVLKPLKKRLEDEGQKIELKDEDTDVESFAKRRTRDSGSGGQRKRYMKRLPKPAYDRGDDDAETTPRAENAEQTPRATGTGGGDMQRRKRTNKGRRMRPTNKNGDTENTGYNGGRAREQKPSSRPPRQLRPQLQNGVRISVTNMFSVPFKEFKQELRNRDCYPAKISQGRNGRCMLIFPRREDAEEQVQVDELLHKLADMRISVPLKNSTEMKQINIKCELQSKPREFDENDATSITSAANRAAKKSAEACTKLANDTTTATTDATTTDTDPDANTNTTTHVNVEELAAKVNAATLLAARAAKAAEAVAGKVLQETKPAIEAENGKEDNKELTDKLLAQVETLTKAGAAALAAGTKAEEAAASTVTADTSVTEPAVSKKEAITAMNDAIQAAARATAAVSYAVALLYELIPPTPTQQQTVIVAPVQTLTRVFGALLPKVDS